MPFKHDREQDKRDAERPVDEAGGGQAEGFELSEKELREQAENFDRGRSPAFDAGEVEAESSPATYSEADEEYSSELEDSDR